MLMDELLVRVGLPGARSWRGSCAHVCVDMYECINKNVPGNLRKNTALYQTTRILHLWPNTKFHFSGLVEGIRLIQAKPRAGKPAQHKERSPC